MVNLGSISLSEQASAVALWLSRVRQWIERIAAYRPLCFALFTAFYLHQVLRIARSKLFWEDEFFTLYLARIPTWHGLLQALGTGADQHPPSFYYLTHACLSVFGSTPVTLRLPSLIGFWLLCLALYEAVRSFTDPLWGLVALLFPMATALSYYATEARGYGLVAGMVAVATLGWLMAVTHCRRAVFLVLLGIGAAGAVSMHYYALIAIACLAAGECARTYVRRALDPAVWLALACALVPIVLFLPLLQRARGYSTHFWAIPVWSEALRFYSTEVSDAVLALVGLVGIAMGIQAALRKHGNQPNPVQARPFPLDYAQTAAVCTLAALPCILMFGAKFVTHGFADRYAIASIVGVTILLCTFLYRLAPAPKMAIAAIVSCLIMSVYQTRVLASEDNETRQVTAKTLHFLDTDGTEVIVLADAEAYYRLSFYAPRSLATRLLYIADPARSLRYLGQDTADRGLLDLRPWFPLRAVTMDQFSHSSGDFLAYGGLTKWTWLTYELPHLGATTLLGRDYNNGLFLVSRGSKAPFAFQTPLPSNMLYLRVPSTGPSICELYMGPEYCDVN